MSQIDELISKLQEVSNHPQKTVLNYKKQGKGLVGMMPYYAPEEIVYAAGYLPVGMFGSQNPQISAARTYLPPFACSLMQADMELQLNGTYDCLDAVIFSVPCDTLRCMSQKWHGKAPVIVFTQPQNRKIRPAVDFLKAEYEHVRTELERILNVKISDLAIQEAIKVYNENRQVMREFCDVAAQYPQIFTPVKHHDVITMVETYRLLASKGDWPLHLGVTEAGPAWQGTIKSCLAFGALLAEGIGDTIRVSLSAPPVEEVKVGCKLLEYMGLRPRKFDIISCPSCGRAQVDVIQLASAVTEGLKDVTAPIRVAVMGCIVNGPGEAREADLGVASGNGKGQIFIKGKVIKTVPEDQIVDTLLTIANDIAAQMEADGQVPVNSTGPVVVPIQHPGH